MFVINIRTTIDFSINSTPSILKTYRVQNQYWQQILLKDEINTQLFWISEDPICKFEFEMQLRLPLVKSSDPRWIDAVLSDFNSFLQDHANCERKASAFAMSLVAKYPDRIDILPELIDTALEEMEHFKEVYAVMQKRSVLLRHEISEDAYIKKLLQLLRSSRDERFLDRLLLGSVIENRGAERFRLVYEAVDDTELKKFYHKLWASEAKHGDIFVKMALKYFPEADVFKRLHELNEKEGEIISSLPFTAALH